MLCIARYIYSPHVYHVSCTRSPPATGVCWCRSTVSGMSYSTWPADVPLHMPFEDTPIEDVRQMYEWAMRQLLAEDPQHILREIPRSRVLVHDGNASRNDEFFRALTLRLMQAFQGKIQLSDSARNFVPANIRDPVNPGLSRRRPGHAKHGHTPLPAARAACSSAASPPGVSRSGRRSHPQKQLGRWPSFVAAHARR